MLDFFTITTDSKKQKIYPIFKISGFHDLLVKGNSFYAIWDNENDIWSRNYDDLIRLIDKDLYTWRDEHKYTNYGIDSMNFYSNNGSVANFNRMLRLVSNSNAICDQKVIFSNQATKKEDYCTHRLSYSLSDTFPVAYDKLMSTLYSPVERHKIEWAIGSIFCGESRYIQKFFVFYGEPGSGKSTVINIIEKLFDGYVAHINVKSMTSENNSFALTPFKSNPLVAVQHDSDLSKIEDNTLLNSVVSHELITINEKYKSEYDVRANALIFLGTNTPVKISNSKSGIIRRLIDILPSGKRVSANDYYNLTNQIDYELGGIANMCINVYKNSGLNFYNAYIPVNMMYMTDHFFDFVNDSYLVFMKQPYVTLKEAWEMYKSYISENGLTFKYVKSKVREELKSYFNIYKDEWRNSEGKHIRNVYFDFDLNKLDKHPEDIRIKKHELVLDKTVSLLDDILSNCPAQYAKDGKPTMKWDDVDTVLRDLDTSKEHFVRPGLDHIVIDFDLKDESGKKSRERNLEEASKWPETYAEFSKSGAGVHLHYIYKGNVTELSRVYSEGIEIKVFTGKAALRRKFTYGNDIFITTIDSGLPLQKGVKDVLNMRRIADEKHLRALIAKNLRKEVHPGTKPSVIFIDKLLNDAYTDGVQYDVTDLWPALRAFANNSTNHAKYCLQIVNQMKLKSEEVEDDDSKCYIFGDSDPLVFFDVEVFPNLFLICYKAQGKENKCQHLINPKPKDIETLLKYRLIGFNNRRYDNHLVYACYIGYTNEQLYNLSCKIIEGKNRQNVFFGDAYNLSYTDVYDFASNIHKKGLKKFEIELGIHHQELGMPWNEPVPEDKWTLVADYCDNDVIATEAVFDYLHSDFEVRKVLSDLSGLSINDTTNSHSTKIIFGNDRNPQKEFIYTDLSEMFPGYIFDKGKSYYRDEITGEGGYVYAEPGYYEDVALLDIQSMHPTSIIQLNLFGDKYTNRFKEIVDARLFIKHHDFESAGKLLDGKLKAYLKEEDADELSSALKTVINSVYGLTSAKFDNKFRDIRNKDNIVAKRGALFMIDLKHVVQEKGFTVAHIKTDSIKIPNPTREIIEYVESFAEKYGYIFEEEAVYSKMCLVNDAVYIAKNKNTNKWTATGAQFAHPYIFKSLFSHEVIEFKDLCETKSVTTQLYLDLNEDLPEGEHNYVFVGSVGSFCPMKAGCGAGKLYRKKDDKYYSVTGTKGYLWMESEVVKNLGLEDMIDMLYFNNLVGDAIDTIAKYVDPEYFLEKE